MKKSEEKLTEFKMPLLKEYFAEEILHLMDIMSISYRCISHPNVFP